VKKIFRIIHLLWVLLIAVAVDGQETGGTKEISLSGMQDGSYATAEYVIDSVVTVGRGRSMSFAPGSIVRFKPYAQLIVKGHLECIGTPSQMITFTSYTHRSGTRGAGTPAAFDWNGIVVVDARASITFRYVRVAYSTFGVKINSKVSNVIMDKVFFTENGNADVTLGDSTVYAEENTMFSYTQPVL
jgi:hypothetical protein